MSRCIQIILFITMSALAICQSLAQVAQDLTLRISDDTGHILEGVNAMISFRDISGQEVAKKGLTDAHGEFTARTEASLETFLQASMPRYYSALVRNSKRYQIPIGKATVPVVLPRILAPTALHAMHVSSIKLPFKDEWLAYDFVAADWVVPFGKGKVRDILFKFKNEF